jgi:hypothetical protein
LDITALNYIDNLQETIVSPPLSGLWFSEINKLSLYDNNKCK